MIKLYSLYFYCLPYAMFWANESLPGFFTSPLLAKRCSPKMRSLYLALDATLLTDLSSELQDLPAGCLYLNVPPSPPAQNAPRGTQPLPSRITPLFVFSISNWHQNLLITSGVNPRSIFSFSSSKSNLSSGPEDETSL